jgi:hypothetical protein
MHEDILFLRFGSLQKAAHHQDEHCQEGGKTENAEDEGQLLKPRTNLSVFKLEVARTGATDLSIAIEPHEV